MFNFDLMKQLRAEGKTCKEASKLLKVSMTTLKRKGWNKLPINKLSIHTYKKDLDFFKNINTNNKSYILGFLLADGCIDKKGSVRFEVQEKDIEVLEFIKSQISPTSPIKYLSRNVSGRISKTVLVYFKAKNYLEDLEHWNILPNKTYKKQTLPNIPFNLMSDFIRGYFDGDGSVWLDGNYPRVSFTGEENLLKEISKFFFTNKIISKECKVYTKYNQHDCVFTFGANKDTKSFYDFIYNKDSFSLNRKKEKFRYELT